jgi:hypothetical protein
VGLFVGSYLPKFLLILSILIAYSLTANSSQSGLIGGSENLKNLVQLIHIIASFEQWLASEHLGKNASHRPHVNYE